jgi:hypothetical protein
MSRLDADCLVEIFEYLDGYHETLYSCLLVNRLWCVVSVRILWRGIKNYYTLITCLPNELKKIISENGITISTSKPLLFNYVSFCKSISVYELNVNIEQILLKKRQCVPIQSSKDIKKQQYVSIQTLKDIKEQQRVSIQSSKDIITQEIFKFLMNQITKLIIDEFSPNYMMIFTRHLESRDRLLNNITELHSYSDAYTEFFHQLSQICHSIQTLKIMLKTVISNGLIDLISVQKNLKYLYMSQYNSFGIENLLKKIPNTLISFAFKIIMGFPNYLYPIENIYIHYPFDQQRYRDQQSYRDQRREEHFNSNFVILRQIMKFLKNNGRNLKQIHFNIDYDPLNETIRECCKNIRILHIKLTDEKKRGLSKLCSFFDALPLLESIKIEIRYTYNEKSLFNCVIEKSPKNFCELKLKLSYNIDKQSLLTPEELELFLKSWKNRIPQKQLSLVLTGYNKNTTFINNEENMKVIEKYSKLGTIKLVNKIGKCKYLRGAHFRGWLSL